MAPPAAAGASAGSGRGAAGAGGGGGGGGGAGALPDAAGDDVVDDGAIYLVGSCPLLGETVTT